MNDNEMNQKMVENSRLVHYILHKHYPSVEYDEDVIQSGMIGLWIALKNFDESKGFQFSTYATRIICNEIAKYFRIYNKQHRIPTSSLDTPIAASKQHGDNKLTISDMIVDPKDLSDHVVYSAYIENVIDTFSCSKRDKDILRLYFKGFNQIEIAKIVNLSQGSVSRILSRLRAKLMQEG